MHGILAAFALRLGIRRDGDVPRRVRTDLVDESGVDNPEYRAWLRRMHRTTADAFDDDDAPAE